MSFLEQPTSPFGESNLPVNLVLYPLQLNPTSPHLFESQAPKIHNLGVPLLVNATEEEEMYIDKEREVVLGKVR